MIERLLLGSGMRIRHADGQLERLEAEPGFHRGLSDAIVKAFRKRMQFIRQARDERDLREIRAHRFEKLKGNRSHQYSMRLNDQMRLILEFEGQDPDKRVVIMGIEDYH